MARDNLWRAFPLLALLGVAGCGWAPQSRVAALEAANRRLGERSQAQLAEIENLRRHADEIEDQLLRAERDLAVFTEQYGIDRQTLARLREQGEQLRDYVADARRMPAGLGGQLAELAKRFPHLHYDPQTGISKLDTDVLFDSGEARLKPEAKQMLREFARIFKSPAARDLKIMVVGHTDDEQLQGRDARHRWPTNWHLSAARALAVSEVLRAEGIDGDRLGIAGYGPAQPIAANTTEAARQMNRRVEIFVMSPQVPIVGMTETLTNLY